MGNIIAIRETDVLQRDSSRPVIQMGQVVSAFNFIIESKPVKLTDNVAIVTGIDPNHSVIAIADIVSRVFNNEPRSENKFIDDNIDPAQLKEFLRRMFAHSTTTFIVIAGLDYITKLASSTSIASEIPQTNAKGVLERLIPQGSVHYLEYKGKKK